MTHTMTVDSQVMAGRLANAGTAKGVLTQARPRSRRASRNMFIAVATVVLAIFLLVGLSAYAASIQHANNVLVEENEYLQAEIDSLKSQIVLLLRRW